MNQEILFKLQMFEQQVQQIQQQIQFLDQNIVELNSLGIDLSSLKNSEGKEIFASVGRGIFIKSKITSDELTVDVGNRNFVKKTVPETQELIQKQIEKINESKDILENNVYEINQELTKLIEEASKKEN